MIEITTSCLWGKQTALDMRQLFQTLALKKVVPLDTFLFIFITLYSLHSDYFMKSGWLRNGSSRFLSQWLAPNENSGARAMQAM